MGPVALIRARNGYGRVLPPGHREMLLGGGPLPDWARAYGSGNSGEETPENREAWVVRLERAARETAAAQEAEEEAAAEARALDIQREMELEDEEEGASQETVLVEPVNLDDEVEAAQLDAAVPGLVIIDDGEDIGGEARPQPWRAPRRAKHRKQRARRAEAAKARADEGGTGEEESPWLVRRSGDHARTEHGAQGRRRRNVAKAQQRKRRIEALQGGGANPGS